MADSTPLLPTSELPLSVYLNEALTHLPPSFLLPQTTSSLLYTDSNFSTWSSLSRVSIPNIHRTTEMGAEKACPAIDRARETLRSQGNRLGPTNHYGPTLGVGRTLAGSKRHRKVVRDNLRCITKGTIRFVSQTKTYSLRSRNVHRKVARRGGVRRLSYDIYDETRIAVKNRLQTVCPSCFHA